MSEIINIGSLSAHIAPVHSIVHPSALHEPAPTQVSEAGDSVEISRFGRTMSQIMTESSLRLAKINAIREQIAEGTFETPARISGTVNRLLDVVG